jgi:hypothetical protein
VQRAKLKVSSGEYFILPDPRPGSFPLSLALPLGGGRGQAVAPSSAFPPWPEEKISNIECSISNVQFFSLCLNQDLLDERMFRMKPRMKILGILIILRILLQKKTKRGTTD